MRPSVMIVTYEGARQWLAEIGGTWEVANEPTPPRTRRAIVVSVRTADGQIVQRHALLDDMLTTGFERRLALRGAFVRACEELKRALE